jgi:hypothetical protein
MTLGAPRLLLLTVAALLSLSLFALPVRADDSNGGLLGNVVKGLLNGAAGDQNKSAPAAQPLSNNLSDALKTSAKPSGPVALVEEVSGVSGIEVMDSLNEGQIIALGKNGKLVLSYTDGCATERAMGGTVTIRQGGSTNSGGQIQTERAPKCVTTRAVATAEAREAGGTVSRATPFQGNGWTDTVVKGPAPVFAWHGSGEAKVTVSLIDVAPPSTIWTGKAKGGRLEYPSKAPVLQRGARHLVEVALPDGSSFGAIFAVDPDLDTLSSVAARLVRVEKPGLTRDAIASTIRPLASSQ